MNIIRPLVFTLLLVSMVKVVNAQAKFTHSHNDYNNNTPFYRAFFGGFNAIEADIFVVGKQLLIAHDRKDTVALRTLKSLYLDPVAYTLQKDSTRQVCLLIDIKDDHRVSLPILQKELEPLKRYLMTPTRAGRLKILISGNRPAPADFKNYPDYLFFDNDLIIQPSTKAQWERVGQVSLNFANYSKWKGQGDIPDADKKRIKKTIDSVHVNTGKLVRFWGIADIPKAWDIQLDVGADIIGTDSMDKLITYLADRKKLQPVTAVIK